MQKHEKIQFRFHSDIFDEEMVETLWAIELDKEKGLYKIDNIPFFLNLVASDDIIHAEFDEKEQQLIYKETVEFGENSLIQIVIIDKNLETNTIRTEFSDLGCQSEKFDEGYFSMEVPSDLNFEIVKKKLDELSAAGKIDYAEPIIADHHSKQLNAAD